MTADRPAAAFGGNIFKWPLGPTSTHPSRVHGILFKPESSAQNLTEETFDRDCKATRLHVPSPATMLGNNTDIERSNASQTANGLIALDEEGQAECPGSLGDRLSDFRGVIDGIGSQTVIPALIVAWPLHG